MNKYKIVSLVDITRSSASRSETDRIKQGQQANFNSLLQAIGLRSNVEWTADPRMNEGRLPHDIGGRARYWTWVFHCERDDVFHRDSDPVGLLKDDLHGVPVVSGLNNSVDIDPACFLTNGEKSNTWIYEYTEIE
jgi:hypothetical protein